ncbi:ferredoxin [Dictyobacter alpinus]|uniref:Ferredoxin n=1 Tax=Dictyobacter alpinus TaxID=2014873 RepID=A0A402BE32_9CHLR|nr:Rieske (2Fe-2S) protein [Dictyobacter alpinus]GCE29552.1 ferredoxin [Dictyobacter alpinus]
MTEKISDRPHVYAVAHIDEIAPGERKLVEVEGKSIGIFNVHGMYRAVLNICPHAYAPICQGRVGGTTLPSPPGEFTWGREGEILFCPWHGWEFDLLSGSSPVDKRHLRLYPLHIEEKTLYIDMKAKKD